MKLLMVCLGNICRSPMAEGIMQQKINKYNLDVEVDSCGTAPYHIGQAPDHRGVQTLKNYDIDISQHRGRQFDVSDFDLYDVIYAMDSSNYSNIKSLARNQEDVGKIKLLLDEIYPGEQKIVPDPYYGGIEDFEETYTLVEAACEHLAKRLVV